MKRGMIGKVPVNKAKFEEGSIPISGDKPHYAPISTLFLILVGVQIVYREGS